MSDSSTPPEPFADHQQTERKQPEAQGATRRDILVVLGAFVVFVSGLITGDPSDIGAGFRKIIPDLQGGAAVAIVFLGYRQWRTMKAQHVAMLQSDQRLERQIELSRQNFEAEHRPWLGCVIELSGPMRWALDPRTGEPTVGLLPLRVNLRNTGRVPATNARVVTEIFPIGGGFPFASLAQERLAQRVRGTPRDKAYYGQDVFPSDTLMVDTTAGLTVSDIDQFAAFFRANPVRDMPPPVLGMGAFVVGVVDYFSPATGKRHQTGFIRRLIRFAPPSGRERRFRFDPDGGEVPLNQMGLSSSLDGTGLID